MSTVHTASPPAQPAAAPGLAALAAAIERIEARQKRLEAGQRRLATEQRRMGWRLGRRHDAETAFLNMRIATLFSMMEQAVAYAGLEDKVASGGDLRQALEVLEGGGEPGRRTRRPALTAVGGSR
jgi:hypothetical protein